MNPDETNHSARNDAAAGQKLGPDAPIRRMRYQEAFEFASNALFATDRQGVILEANHAAAALLAFSKEFLIGKPLAFFVEASQRQRLYQSLHRLMTGVSSDTFAASLTRHRGTVRHVFVTGRVGERNETHTVGRRLFWIVRDVTEERQAESERVNLLFRLATAQEEERRRLARDLHDHMGQTITALKLGIQTVRSAGSLPSEAAERLEHVEKLADELSHQLHDVALRLRPTVLDDLGLAAALRDLVAKWSTHTGISAAFQVAGIDLERLPPEVETALFRVVQEALTNVAKHAKAKRVAVVAACRDGSLVVIVEDDGRGFDPESPAVTQSQRLGLAGMRERIAMAGGSLEIESTHGEGTTLYARIPLPPPLTKSTNP